ncbi:MAG: HAD-IC family P-type ATPase [Patescibacteria group bacterium]
MFNLKSQTNQKEKPYEIKWWSFNLEETFDRLSSSAKGLSEHQIKNKQEHYGLNELPHKESDRWWQIILSQIKSAMVIILVIASFVSFILGDIIDASVILLAVIINVAVGFWQEIKTSNALKALQRVVVTQAKVIRGGEEKVVDTYELVPGDIVVLSAGDKVPADLRLFKAVDLKINEAILTGEADPRNKESKVLDAKTILAERINMAFMGTNVVSGNGVGIVVEIGSATAIGRIAELVASVREDATPLQKKLNSFALFLTKVVLATAFLVLILGLVFRHDFTEMFTTAVAIAVSAIPEGLAVIVTVVLATGMQRILKRGALVKKMLGAETLGSTNVICADKTGTLTEGKMQVVEVITEDMKIDLKSGAPELTPEASEEQLFVLRIGVLCNNAYIAHKEGELKIDHLVGNLTERALLLAGYQLGLERRELEKQSARLDEIPFDSRYKFMMTLNKFDKENNIIYLKGAPEKVLLFSNYLYSKESHYQKLTPSKRAKFIETYEEMSKRGLRVLALGYKKVQSEAKIISDKKMKEFIEDVAVPEKFDLEEKSVVKQTIPDIYTNFVLVGLVGIKDPVRENVKETIEITRKAGIKTVIITGDNKFTAKVIAKEVGFDIDEKNILEGEDLEKISETGLKEKVENIKLYARVTPEQKLKIVNAWQDTGVVVAMTGDGINDAPALKKADIGVALGTATDVAKEASDLVLLKNNFQTIVEAVKQGRIIYENIKKIVLYFLSDSLCEVLVIVVALFLKWPLPILASQIIWVNLIDDTFPALALTQDPASHDVMQDKPVKRDANILDKENRILVFAISLTIALFIILSFWFFWQGKENNFALANTIAFTILAVTTLFYVFSVRNLSKPIWRTNILDNNFLIISVFFGFILQCLAIYSPFLQDIFHTIPLNLFHWLYIIILCILVVLVIELIKFVFNKYIKK